MKSRSRRKRRTTTVRATGWVLGLAALVGALWQIRRSLRLAAVPPPLTDERPLIVIDAGHGGEDGGTQGFGVLEKEVALDTAIRLSRELRRRGQRTLLTREADVTLPLAGRAQIANEQGAVALVSVHFNFSTESDGVHGLEVFYSAPKEAEAGRRIAERLGVASDAPEIDAASLALAAAVREGACARAHTPDRGTRNRPDLAVTRRTACPAVLVECAYLSNPTDAQRAKSAAWRGELAVGLADGVAAWLARQPARPGAGP